MASPDPGLIERREGMFDPFNFNDDFDGKEFAKAVIDALLLAGLLVVFILALADVAQ